MHQPIRPVLDARRLAITATVVELYSHMPDITRTNRDPIFGISARDPGQLGGAAATLAAAATIGSLLPARRASQPDPMNALRDE
jgi:hypothetical protein